MPDAHVTVQPSGQAIATTGGHRLATRSRPRKSHHCSSPTATPVARLVMSRAPIPVPAPVSHAPTASPMATPNAVAKIHSGPTLRYLRTTPHWTHRHERQQPADREAQEGEHPPEEEPPADRPGAVASGHDRSPPSLRWG